MKKTIAALLALVLLFSLAACSTPTESQQPNATTAPTKPTEPLPEIYNRKSYTGTAEDMIAHRSDVVATFGDAKLTNGLLQMYYWMDVYNFLNSYSSSLSQYGLDINKPLDQQTCTGTAGTWQHYFLAGALEGWAYYQALALAADENNIPLTPDRQKIMDTLQDDLLKKAVDQGFATIDAMVQSDAGIGCTAEDYIRYTEIYHKALSYSDSIFRKIEVTDEMINNYFTEKEAHLAVNGINKDSGDSFLVRHILIEVGKDKTDKDWDECRKQAQELLDTWQAGEATEDSFAELAKEHSADPGSKSDGGLYRGLSAQTNFVQEFKDWYLDSSRKPGDYGMIKTSYGYHLMYFSGTEPIWYYYCREMILNEKFDETLASTIEKYKPDLRYEEMLIGEVKLTEEK